MGKATLSPFKRLHDGLEDDNPRRPMAKILDSHLMDACIFFLVMFDVLCVSIECSIDLHLVCVQGATVHMSPSDLEKLAATHEGSHGAAMLDIGSSHLQKWGQKHLLDREYVGVESRQDLTELHSLSRPLDFLQMGSSQALAAQHEEESEALVCETREGPLAHRIHLYAHIASIVLLSIMLVELTAKAYAHPHGFFTNPWLVLDLVVVSISWVLDVFLEEQLEGVLGALILIRLWRVVRIFHGLHELHDHEKESFEKLEHKLAEAEDRCRSLESENQKLKGDAGEEDSKAEQVRQRQGRT
eukprot:TRINITY_DN100604_c0_g1_i1.p1 TRINITY_DN100604_c0_g1~~TRINITY_DN100604_c0_g1_i1.p1  ORF type:complete len:300 (+),score=44.98 TRINITY_DN100604_c0_g1_i1:94-993(+)